MKREPKDTESSQAALAERRAFLMKLVLAEVIARPGEGPLAPRFRGPWASRMRMSRAEETQPEEQPEKSQP